MQKHKASLGYSTHPLRTLTGAGLAALMIAGFAPAAAADQEEPEEVEEAGASDELDQPEMEDAELLLVMDASGSMSADDAGGQTRIAAAKDALSNLLDTMDEDEAVGLRIFSGEVTDSGHPDACEDSHLAVDIGTDNRDELAGAIDDYDAVGAMTPLAHALEEAAEDFDGDGPRTIVLVSDGEENCDPEPCEAAQAIADQGIDLQVHTVGFNIDEEDSDAAVAREQLQCIANAGGGDYYDANDAESLSVVLERLSLRAFEPFQLEGEEVEGATHFADDRPVLEPGGQYLDTIHPDNRYYTIPRTMEGSTLHVGVTTLRDLDSDRAFSHIKANLGTSEWDGNDSGGSRTGMCEWVYLTESTRARAVMARTGGLTSVPDPGGTHEDCGSDDEMILSVELQEDDEAYAGKPFEIVVWEEPPAENAEELPERYSDNIGSVEWHDMELDERSENEVLGGNSFNNATPLDPGETYAGTSLLGETQVFRVPVDWGEQLQVELLFPEDADVPSPLGIGGSELQVINPHRGDVVPNQSSANHPHRVWDINFAQGGRQTAQVQTYPVQYNNRTPNNYGRTAPGDTAVAGDYYVVVNVGEYSDPNVSTQLPFYLHVETFSDGSTGEVEPVYAETTGGQSEGGSCVPPEEDEEEAEEAGVGCVPPPEEEDEDDDGADEASAEAQTAGTGTESEDPAPSEAADEEDSFFSSTTGLIVGLSAFAMLLLTAGGLVLARALRKS